MKKSIYLIGLTLGLALPAGAALYSSGTLNAGTVIPDNNTLGTGDTLTYTLSGAEPSISALSLSFTLQGGFASDLSGYLRLGNTGSSPSYDLTSLIQSQTISGGGTTYSIDFNTGGFSTAFSGQNPNNTWTLFFADTSAGGTTTLNGWNLDVTAVPEPVNTALIGFGAILAGLGLWRRWPAARRQSFRSKTLAQDL